MYEIPVITLIFDHFGDFESESSYFSLFSPYILLSWPLCLEKFGLMGTVACSLVDKRLGPAFKSLGPTITFSKDHIRKFKITRF